LIKVDQLGSGVWVSASSQKMSTITIIIVIIIIECLNSVFENVNAQSVMDFIKKIQFYHE